MYVFIYVRILYLSRLHYFPDCYKKYIKSQSDNFENQFQTTIFLKILCSLEIMPGNSIVSSACKSYISRMIVLQFYRSYIKTRATRVP